MATLDLQGFDDLIKINIHREGNLMGVMMEIVVVEVQCL